MLTAWQLANQERFVHGLSRVDLCLLVCCTRWADVCCRSSTSNGRSRLREQAGSGLSQHPSWHAIARPNESNFLEIEIRLPCGSCCCTHLPQAGAVLQTRVQLTFGADNTSTSNQNCAA